MRALITLLVLGTSSVAIARPIQPGYEAGYDQPIVRDHRDNMTFAPPPAPPATQVQPLHVAPLDFRFRARPVLLADEVSFMRQSYRDHRPLRIDIDQRSGSFRKLRLDRSVGRMFIDAVVVTYADGHQQTIDLDQTLSNRLPSLTIDLDHRGATRIDIYGSTHRGRATFDVIGLRR